MPKKKKATPKSDFYLDNVKKKSYFLSGKQFEIVKFRKGDDDKDLSVNGHTPYFRILITKVS